MARRPIVPITFEMTVRAAGEDENKPRYMGPGVLEDWHGGDAGNEVDVNAATQAIASKGSPDVEDDYEPHHQEEKGEMMHQPMTVLGDIGLDYGVHTGQTGRTGAIGPRDPYPTTPPAGPATVVRGNAPVAVGAPKPSRIV